MACRQRAPTSLEKGIASVEFAIGTLAILTLMLVSVEIGRVYFSYHSLTKAVRSGSRLLSTTALNTAGIVELTPAKQQNVRNLVVTGDPGGTEPTLIDGLQPQHVSISHTQGMGATRQYVEVRAMFPYEPLIGNLVGLGESYRFSFTMQAVSSMAVLK